MITRGSELPLGLALLIAVSGCGDEARLASPPARLDGLALHHRVSGARALAALSRLHDGGEFEMADAWIAHYGADTSAMLYVGEGASPAVAESLLVAMRSRIEDNIATPFAGLRDLRLSGQDVFLMSGQGQLHFLYRDGPQVVWLSAHPAAACAALADALGGNREEDCKT